jgi:hypothetical protein
MLPRPTYWQKARSPPRRPERAAVSKNPIHRVIMTELFYWKELERRARAAQALAMLRDNTDEAVINRANAILDEICLDRNGAERLIRSRMRALGPQPRANLVQWLA